MTRPDDPLSWPRRVVALFLDRFAAAEPRPDRRVDRLDYSIHLTSGTRSVELFPAGPLDPLRFYQRHHASLHHEFEYLSCLPAGSPAEEFLAYAVFRLNEEEELPLVDLNGLERQLQLHYGQFVHLPRARPLLEHQYGSDLNDEDPPSGSNRVVAPRDEEQAAGRMTIREVLRVLVDDLEGQELVSWIEGAFRQRPPAGTVEHRYYLDRSARVYLVRDHFREGKRLYRSETSRAALSPLRG
ncbi:MAG: hypothetical protein AB7N76_28730 [Planctomycetota bacterium]